MVWNNVKMKKERTSTSKQHFEKLQTSFLGAGIFVKIDTSSWQISVLVKLTKNVLRKMFQLYLGGPPSGDSKWHRLASEPPSVCLFAAAASIKDSPFTAATAGSCRCSGPLSGFPSLQQMGCDSPSGLFQLWTRRWSRCQNIPEPEDKNQTEVLVTQETGCYGNVLQLGALANRGHAAPLNRNCTPGAINKYNNNTYMLCTVTAPFAPASLWH